MNNNLRYALFALLGAAVLGSCSKDKNVGNYGTAGATGTSVSLQASSPVTIGMETDYAAALDSANYLATAAANASQTTFGYTMKYGAVVQNDGSFNFAPADAQYAAVTAKGMKVWGHNLMWYQNQNVTYLNEVLGGKVVMPNLVTNGDFENWSNATAAPSGWSYFNGPTYFSQGTGSNAEGNYSMAVAGYGAGSGSGWRVQLGYSVPTIAGHVYTVTFDAKASGAGGSVQGEWANGNGPQYTGDYPITTSWANYNFKTMNSTMTMVAPAGASTTITFDMAVTATGTTVYLDNVVVTDQTAADSIANALATPAEKAARVDSVFKLWVTNMVTHYKGKVVGWDVINELFADDGSIRNNTNTTSSTATDWFVWSNYLGKNAGVEAFNIAHSIDPNALLFINDYGLEGGTVHQGSQKLDSLIAYVNWLTSQGVHIDGIGTEMHISISTAKTGIDYMFQRLAATGLKVRISELDVSVNNVKGFLLTPQVLAYQAQTYHDVVASFLANVPAAQRQDITIWGVNDCNSWHYNNGTDFPLLFDNSYATKPAFNGFLQALKGQ